MSWPKPSTTFLWATIITVGYMLYVLFAWAETWGEMTGIIIGLLLIAWVGTGMAAWLEGKGW